MSARPGQRRRTVYQTPHFNVGWARSAIAAAGLALLIFGILPFTTVVSTQRTKQLALRNAELSAPPPGAEEPPPPPPPEEKPPEEPPPPAPDIPQQTTLSTDLDNISGLGGRLLDNIGSLGAGLAADAGGAFDAADLDNRPEPVSQSSPVYPRELSKARIDGRVVIAFIVNEDGRVEDPRIENSTRPEFEQPALEAIRRWRFKPGMKDNQPVRTFVKQPMKFTPPSR